MAKGIALGNWSVECSSNSSFSLPTVSSRQLAVQRQLLFNETYLGNGSSAIESGSLWLTVLNPIHIQFAATIENLLHLLYLLFNDSGYEVVSHISRHQCRFQNDFAAFCSNVTASECFCCSVLIFLIRPEGPCRHLRSSWAKIHLHHLVNYLRYHCFFVKPKSSGLHSRFHTCHSQPKCLQQKINLQVLL